MAQHRQSRIGIGGGIAVLAVAGLLASGFGLLGGRPEATPAASAVTAVGSPSIPIGPGRTPAVTPYADCGPEPAVPPVITLQTNGVPTVGLVERIDRDAEPSPTAVVPTPADPLDLLRGPRVEVRPDVVTELWIDEAACALRWFVALYDPRTDEGFEIEGAAMDDDPDPLVAAQNRFSLGDAMALRRGRGNDLQLIGAFEFTDLAVVAWWRVEIPPIDIPAAALRDGGGQPIRVVPGCDMHLRLGTGYEERIETCDDDLTAAPGVATRVPAGGPLTLDFGDVGASDVHVACGRLSGLSFVAEPEPGCWDGPVDGQSMTVPDAGGSWTLAMSTCVSLRASAAGAFNNLCGTWYSNVEIVAG